MNTKKITGKYRILLFFKVELHERQINRNSGNKVSYSNELNRYQFRNEWNVDFDDTLCFARKSITGNSNRNFRIHTHFKRSNQLARLYDYTLDRSSVLPVKTTVISKAK